MGSLQFDKCAHVLVHVAWFGSLSLVLSVTLSELYCRDINVALDSRQSSPDGENTQHFLFGCMLHGINMYTLLCVLHWLEAIYSVRSMVC